MPNEKAQSILKYVRERGSSGVPPTIREIMAALGFKSTSTVQRYVNQLLEENLLEKIDGVNRSLRAVGKTSIQVPLIGTVTAGLPITAIENLTDYISFQEDHYYNYPLFALKIRGDSMVNSGILNNDIVIVEQNKLPTNGDIIIALLDGCEATCKRYYKENGKFRLQPENDNFQPIIVDELEVLGKVVAVLRYL